MSFLGGLVVGAAVGLSAGVLLARPRRRDPEGEPGRSARARRRSSNRSPATIVIAALALAASGVALARSNEHQAPTGPAATDTTAATTATGPLPTAPATTRPAASAATVSVPNVVGLDRATAEATLERVGLATSVSTLALSNVPAGFVVTESPPTAALVAKGTKISLVVSVAP
jgi:hypothetical protein